jgi:hypothetical protein
MEKNAFGVWTWAVEIVFLVLALTAPLNPLLTTKTAVFVWCFVMMGLGSIGVVLQVYKGYPPEEFSLKGETRTGEVHHES